MSPGVTECLAERVSEHVMHVVWCVMDALLWVCHVCYKCYEVRCQMYSCL